jgi:putative YhdH/YhfP family quinone oxidoreductase
MENKSFKAMVITETEEKKYTRNITNRTIDSLPEGDVVINVQYSSLNFKDALSSAGNKGVTRNYPHTPGIDAAGVVAESASDQFKAGDEVLVTGYDLGMNTSGGLAEYIRVPAEWVVPLPANLSLKESMVYGTAGFTAAMSCYKMIENGVKPDQGRVLVTGATGGVGSIAVSILAKSGYQVVAVNGLVDEADYLKTLGAVEVISIEEATDTSGRILGKQAWAGVIDCVGGDILATALKSTQYGGTVTCCGNVGSGDLGTSVYPFILRGVSLLGIDSVNCPVALRLSIWEKVAADWKLDHLAEITTELPNLEAVEERLDMMLERKSKGRAIVRIA